MTEETLILLILGVILLVATSVYILYLFRVQKEYKEFRSCVINLARRRERMIQFGRHYSLPIPYEIFDAVDGATLDSNKLMKLGILGDAGMQSLMDTKNGVPKKHHYQIGSIGAVGCSLSHIKIWQKMVLEDIKYMMVFEDDAWVMGIQMDDLITRLGDLPADWHIYIIGHPHTILEGLPVQGKSHLYKVTRFCGTHGYIINNDGAQWLLAQGKLFPIQQQIDAHLSELGWEHGLNIYIHLNKPMYGVFSAFSDIQVNSSQSTWERFRLKK